MYSRRTMLGAGLAGLSAVAISAWWPFRLNGGSDAVPLVGPQPVGKSGMMPMRSFGSTGMQVSEVGFGAWGIGGQSYGSVQRSESLAVLARAEELGCNFVDTAAVYGDSENLLGEFLVGRRSRWLISTKYSGQSEGLERTLERQLQALRTDFVDLYMIHWVPGQEEQGLFDQIESVRKAGKIRYAGVSLYNVNDIDRILDDPRVDGFMVALNLLDPHPFLARRARIAASGKGVIARSSLKEGFLAGGFSRETRFTDPADQRSEWSVQRIEQTVAQVERFRFLQERAGTMARAAMAYPLSFPEISTVVAGTKRLWEADENFGKLPGYRLTTEELERVYLVQKELGLDERLPLVRRMWSKVRSLF